MIDGYLGEASPMVYAIAGGLAVIAAIAFIIFIMSLINKQENKTRKR